MGTNLLRSIIVPVYRNVLKVSPVLSYPCNGPKLLTSHKLISEIHTTSLCYGKSKDKGKEKKKKGAKVAVNFSVISELIPVEKLQRGCQAAIEKMKEDFSKNLTLRSTTGSIESLKVKFEGKDYELQELSQIVRKNPKTIVINFSSFPQAIPDALKAISSSGLNLNPQQDGTTLYVPVPKVTKEHREALAKNAKALYIKCRDNIKDVQNENLKKVKRQTTVSEDLIFEVTQQINSLCEEYQETAKNIFESKHNELLSGTK